MLTTIKCYFLSESFPKYLFCHLFVLVETSLSHMDQRDDNFPKHQRRRSRRLFSIFFILESCLYYKTPVKDGLIVPVANSNNIQFPPPVPIRYVL